MKKQFLSLILLAVCGVSMVYVQSCKKEEYTISTTADVNIVGYLDKQPDSFSLFRQILDRTGTAAFFPPSTNVIKTLGTGEGLFSFNSFFNVMHVSLLHPLRSRRIV